MARDPVKKRAAQKRYAANNPEKTAARNAAAYKLRYGNPVARAKTLWHAAKSRSKKNKEPFSLTLQHVIDGVTRGCCPKTGVPFNLTKPTKRHYNPCGPSLDRTDPGGTYNDNNVQIVAWRYNSMKNDDSEKELLEWCRCIVQNHEKENRP